MKIKKHTIAVNKVIEPLEINKAITNDIGNNNEIKNNMATDINVVVDVSAIVLNGLSEPTLPGFVI
jgi:hypothetical protein